MKVINITNTVTHKFATGLLGITLLTTSGAFAVETYKAGSYNLDPMHSKIGFEIPHLVISTVEGSFKQSEGLLTLNEKFNSSNVTITTAIASIDTGVDKRDDHLKSADFFDAQQFPNMKFESTEIKGTPKSFKIIGNLTIKGITKKVTFEARYLGSVKDGYGQQKVAFSATSKIHRKDFGLTWNSAVEAGPVVGDEVTLELKIQAAQIADKK